ncbi:hypothetical protein [Bradyrhizobium sp. SZCCHNS3002]|uniref:hypothetical protein n=1 Tax=unclassified Bradyrhizobium TaxID=2631580 RepID=UPI00396580BB
MTNDEYNPLQQFHQTSPVACIERLVRVREEFRLLSVVRWFWFSAEVISLIPGSKMGMPLRAQQLMQLIVTGDHLAQMIGVANSPLMLMEVAGLTRAILARRAPCGWHIRVAVATGLGGASRCGRTAYLQATQGELLPRLSQAAADGGEGATPLIQKAYVQGVPTRSAEDLAWGAMAWAESPGAG